jgi:DNA-binding CsgD family transcriptional regulator
VAAGSAGASEGTWPLAGKAAPGRANFASPQHGPSREGIAPGGRDGRAQVGDGSVLQLVHGAKRAGLVAYELQRAATELVQAAVKPPGAVARSLDSLETFKLAEGVAYRVLYDRSALAHPAQLNVTSRMVSLGEQARMIEGVPTSLLIVDRAIALLPLTINQGCVDSAVVLRGSEMLAAMKRIFDDLWRSADALTAEHEAAPGESGPSEQERWILSLLASGATDDTIGRLMGLSARTAHRRVRELIARLGAQTRFQAGMRAVELGWL